MPAEPAIAVDQLVKTYNTTRAVDGISFALERGSITGLLGGNGAGKTTTIAMILGLVMPTSGSARVLGAAFRVAHLISAARPGVLLATHFRSSGRRLLLVFEHRMVDLVADRVGSRFKQLARLVGRSGTIVRR